MNRHLRHTYRARRIAAWLAAFLVAVQLPAEARAAPNVSCQLESWLMTLETQSTRYAKSIGSGEQSLAARAFRTEMQKYPNANINRQISVSGLGQNATALQAYLEARRYLIQLDQAARHDEAARFAKDPRFAAQGDALRSFFKQMNCDPDAPNFLGPDPGAGKSAEVREKNREQAGLVVARNAARATEQGHGGHGGERGAALMGQTPAATLAVRTMGLFASIVVLSSSYWMRHRVVKKRSRRHACSIPIEVVWEEDEHSATLVDISQIGAKIRCDGDLPQRSRIGVKIGLVERQARVIWSNEHFKGISFTPALSAGELATLLGPGQSAFSVPQARPAGIPTAA